MQILKNVILSLLREKGIEESFEFKVPPKPEWGDLTTNLPAKIWGKYKVDISMDLKERLEKLDIVEKVEAVRGNLNIFLRWNLVSEDLLKGIFSGGINYFKENLGEGKTVVIDYFSVNIARLPHFGHLRSGVIGSFLRNLFEFFGYKVIGVNFWGDVGTQFGALIYAFKKWGSFEELKKEGIRHLMKLYVKFHEEKEKDPSIWERAKEEYKKIEEGDPENRRLLELFREMTRKRLKKTWYNWFNLRFEDERGESDFIDKAKEVVREFLERGIAFKGENGEIRIDLEKFKLGKPVLLKSDGTTIYLSRDLAAAINHYERYNFSKKIYVVSNEQSLHFKQLSKILEISGYPFYKDLYHLKFGMVLMKTEGGAKKMSTRKGRAVSAEDAIRRTKLKVKRIMWRNKNVPRDMIDSEAWKVAIGSIVFFILKYDPNKDIVFDWGKILDFNGFSGPFVQYSLVRAKSILKKAGEFERIYKIGEINEKERELLRTMLRTGLILKESLRSLKPNLLMEHLYFLSRSFNEFYESCPVLKEKGDKKYFRLTLVEGFARLMEGLLKLSNIPVPERM